VEHWRKLGNTPDVEEKAGSHRGGLSAVKRFGGGKTTAFRRWWNSGGWRQPLGRSTVRGGKVESEGQPDWSQDMHGGELPKRRQQRRWRLQNRRRRHVSGGQFRRDVEEGLGGGRAQSDWGRNGARRKRGRRRVLVPLLKRARRRETLGRGLRLGVPRGGGEGGPIWGCCAGQGN
jgi:hypothetical protein